MEITIIQTDIDKFTHQKSKDDIFNYAVTIDSVEQLINLNLYKALPNRHERKIEKSLDISYFLSSM